MKPFTVLLLALMLSTIPPFAFAQTETGEPVELSEVPEAATAAVNAKLGELFTTEYIEGKLSFAYVLQYTGPEYEFVYAYDVPFVETGANQSVIRVSESGVVISYKGPDEPYAFSIDEANAKEIAAQNGMSTVSTAFIVYGKNGLQTDSETITESYVWKLTNTNASGGTPNVLYLDVDSGIVVGTQMQPSTETPNETETPSDNTNETPAPVQADAPDWNGLAAIALLIIAALIFMVFKQK